MNYNLKNFEQTPKKTSKKKKGKKPFSVWFSEFTAKKHGKYVTSMFATWLVCGVISLLLLYGPWGGFRTYLVTSSMTTINHKYIAHIFYTDKTIENVMSSNTVNELDTTTDASGIYTRTGDNEITCTDISKNGYHAWMLEISDPSSVFLGVSKYFGVKGQKIPYLIENYQNAVAGINAGGFGDAGGWGNGGIAMGLVISEGEILYMPNKSTYDVIGFNKDNVLVLGKYTKSEVMNLDLRDAVEFTPALIINGETAEIKGNGGWGLAPRTAIGQRQDGTVVFVVIDGRSISSTGVTIKTLQEIMVEQNCVNAANLDGGSSTVLYYDEEVVNNPSGSDKDGMRFLPNAFLVNK